MELKDSSTECEVYFVLKGMAGKKEDSNSSLPGLPNVTQQRHSGLKYAVREVRQLIGAWLEPVLLSILSEGLCVPMLLHPQFFLHYLLGPHEM